jgi:hypothetical protein
MAVTTYPHTILGLLHSLKKSMKLYNYFVVLYNINPTQSIETYNDIFSLSNRLILFIDDRDKIELCKIVENGIYNFIDESDVKYRFISDTELFDADMTDNLIDSEYQLYISKLIKWSNLPHNKLLGINNSFTFNNIALCYSNELITSTIELPTKGIILLNNELSESVTKSFDIYDNTSINLIVNLTKE